MNLDKESFQKCECGANLYSSITSFCFDMTKLFCKGCKARYKYWWRSQELIKEEKHDTQL